MATASSWFFWALRSAVFAALTAIFAKIGLEGVDSDLATLVRTGVIVILLGGFVYFSGKWTSPFDLSPRTWSFLVLSGLATGASWVCYFRALKIGEASKVAPVDKLSLVLVAHGPRVAGHCHGGGGRARPHPEEVTGEMPQGRET